MNRRIVGWAGEPRTDRREIAWVLAAMALAVIARLAYVLATSGHVLAGDEIGYHQTAILATQGNWFWTECCFGIPHESLQKAPGYPAWLSFWYVLLGPRPDVVMGIQALLAPFTIGLTWLLGRRLFSPAVGVAAAFVAAIAPNVWQYDVLLYSEVLATPLTLLVLLLVLDRGVDHRRVLAVGALLGVALLVRPSSVLLFAGVLVAWWVVAGARRGITYTAAAAGVAALVVAPWAVRNLIVEPDRFTPISIQSSAAFGTFNEEAASDPVWPYKWRPDTPVARELLAGPPLDDAALAEALDAATRAYIADHPLSVPQAFFWNGVSRLWDLRRPQRAIDSARFEGRGRAIATAALIGYWVMVPFALAALWQARRRTALVAPLLAVALAASVVYTADGGTRYRAPLEPVIVVLACASTASAAARLRARRIGSPTAASASW